LHVRLQLQNHNLQLKQQCDGLMGEVEAAKRQLAEYQQKLQEEQEKTTRAVVSVLICVLFVFVGCGG